VLRNCHVICISSYTYVYIYIEYDPNTPTPPNTPPPTRGGGVFGEVGYSDTIRYIHTHTPFLTEGKIMFLEILDMNFVMLVVLVHIWFLFQTLGLETLGLRGFDS
jgi:hypothetical protein